MRVPLGLPVSRDDSRHGRSKAGPARRRRATMSMLWQMGRYALRGGAGGSSAGGGGLAGAVDFAAAGAAAGVDLAASDTSSDAGSDMSVAYLTGRAGTVTVEVIRAVPHRGRGKPGTMDAYVCCWLSPKPPQQRPSKAGGRLFGTAHPTKKLAMGRRVREAENRPDLARENLGKLRRRHRLRRHRVDADGRAVEPVPQLTALRAWSSGMAAVTKVVEHVAIIEGKDKGCSFMRSSSRFMSLRVPRLRKAARDEANAVAAAAMAEAADEAPVVPPSAEPEVEVYDDDSDFVFHGAFREIGEGDEDDAAPVDAAVAAASPADASDHGGDVGSEDVASNPVEAVNSPRWWLHVELWACGRRSDSLVGSGALEVTDASAIAGSMDDALEQPEATAPATSQTAVLPEEIDAAAQNLCGVVVADGNGKPVGKVVIRIAVAWIAGRRGEPNGVPPDEDADTGAENDSRFGSQFDELSVHEDAWSGAPEHGEASRASAISPEVPPRHRVQLVSEAASVGADEGEADVEDASSEATDSSSESSTDTSGASDLAGTGDEADAGEVGRTADDKATKVGKADEAVAKVMTYSTHWDASGSSFYVNNATGEASWEPPEGLIPVEETLSPDPQLGDSDWEMHNDDQGTVFFHNRASGRSKWARDWQMHYDEEGTPYYWNLQTGESDWVDPDKPSAPLPSPIGGHTSAPPVQAVAVTDARGVVVSEVDPTATGSTSSERGVADAEDNAESKVSLPGGIPDEDSARGGDSGATEGHVSSASSCASKEESKHAASGSSKSTTQSPVDGTEAARDAPRPSGGDRLPSADDDRDSTKSLSSNEPHSGVASGLDVQAPASTRMTPAPASGREAPAEDEDSTADPLRSEHDAVYPPDDVVVASTDTIMATTPAPAGRGGVHNDDGDTAAASNASHDGASACSEGIVRSTTQQESIGGSREIQSAGDEESALPSKREGGRGAGVSAAPDNYGAAGPPSDDGQEADQAPSRDELGSLPGHHDGDSDNVASRGDVNPVTEDVDVESVRNLDDLQPVVPATSAEEGTADRSSGSGEAELAKSPEAEVYKVTPSDSVGEPASSTAEGSHDEGSDASHTEEASDGGTRSAVGESEEGSPASTESRDDAPPVLSRSPSLSAAHAPADADADRSTPSPASATSAGRDSPIESAAVDGTDERVRDGIGLEAESTAQSALPPSSESLGAEGRGVVDSPDAMRSVRDVDEHGEGETHHPRPSQPQSEGVAEGATQQSDDEHVGFLPVVDGGSDGRVDVASPAEHAAYSASSGAAGEATGNDTESVTSPRSASQPRDDRAEVPLEDAGSAGAPLGAGGAAKSAARSSVSESSQQSTAGGTERRGSGSPPPPERPPSAESNYSFVFESSPSGEGGKGSRAPAGEGHEHLNEHELSHPSLAQLAPPLERALFPDEDDGPEYQVDDSVKNTHLLRGSDESAVQPSSMATFNREGDDDGNHASPDAAPASPDDGASPVRSYSRGLRDELGLEALPDDEVYSSDSDAASPAPLRSGDDSTAAQTASLLPAQSWRLPAAPGPVVDDPSEWAKDEERPANASTGPNTEDAPQQEGRRNAVGTGDAVMEQRRGGSRAEARALFQEAKHELDANESGSVSDDAEEAAARESLLAAERKRTEDALRELRELRARETAVLQGARSGSSGAVALRKPKSPGGECARSFMYCRKQLSADVVHACSRFAGAALQRAESRRLMRGGDDPSTKLLTAGSSRALERQLELASAVAPETELVLSARRRLAEVEEDRPGEMDARGSNGDADDRSSSEEEAMVRRSGRKARPPQRSPLRGGRVASRRQRPASARPHTGSRAADEEERMRRTYDGLSAGQTRRPWTARDATLPRANEAAESNGSGVEAWRDDATPVRRPKQRPQSAVPVRSKRRPASAQVRTPSRVPRRRPMSAQVAPKHGGLRGGRTRGRARRSRSPKRDMRPPFVATTRPHLLNNRVSSDGPDDPLAPWNLPAGIRSRKKAIAEDRSRSGLLHSLAGGDAMLLLRMDAAPLAGALNDVTMRRLERRVQVGMGVSQATGGTRRKRERWGAGSRTRDPWAVPRPKATDTARGAGPWLQRYLEYQVGKQQKRSPL